MPARASQAGRRGFESRLPLLKKPVDTRCQRAFSLDGASTYVDRRIDVLSAVSPDKLPRFVTICPSWTVFGANSGAS